MADQDFYSLLGLSQNCTVAEIKQAYKKLARTYHPDNKDTGNEEQFKKLGEAYSVLSDEQKRAYYDRVGHSAYVNAGAAGGGYGGGYSSEMFDDLQGVFDSFFGGAFGGGRSSKNRRERGADLQTVLELDFMEAAFGGAKQVTINKMANCTTCSGSGADPSVGPKTCTTCNGTGEVKKVTQSFLAVINQVVPCGTCNGKGTVNPVPCKSCKGSGQLRVSEDLEVKVPKGVENGSRLVWSGKGNEGKNGGPPGDLYLLLKVKPHAKLTRKGLDTFEEANVTIWQAIMGDDLEVETIHGKQKISLKPATQPNTVLKLASMGIKLDNGKAGSHHVKVSVVVPSKKDLPKNLVELIQSEVSKTQTDKSSHSNFTNFFK